MRRFGIISVMLVLEGCNSPLMPDKKHYHDRTEPMLIIQGSYDNFNGYYQKNGRRYFVQHQGNIIIIDSHKAAEINAE